jgi:uncharacterized protein (TIGR02466 family)
MTSVKSCDCFSTVISQFSLNIEHSHMMKRILLSSDKLHEDKVFKTLVNHILKSTTSVLEKQQYQYDKIEITNMWGNTLSRGDDHPPHTHSNNILSGVYYLRASEEASPIQFFDPRPQASTFKPRNKSNWNNSSMIQFNPVVGIGFIFPSWLMHWVPPTKAERVSISWNIIVRGDYGEPNTLQNAHI